MTPKQEAAMQQALEALENHTAIKHPQQRCYRDDAIEALREALAEQAQEPKPVAWMHNEIEGNTITHRPASIDRHPERWTALYTAPPQRKPLTDEEIQEAVTKAVRERKLSWMGFSKDEQGQYTIPVLSPYHYELVRVIEAKLKEKNT